MVDIRGTGFPFGNPKRLALFDFSRLIVGILRGCNVGVRLIKDDVTGAGFGFGDVVTVNVTEGHAHRLCSALFRG